MDPLGLTPKAEEGRPKPRNGCSGPSAATLLTNHAPSLGFANNWLYYFRGFLTITILYYWAPKPTLGGMGYEDYCWGLYGDY